MKSKPSSTKKGMALEREAVANCYMLARREIARIKRETPSNTRELEKWKHIVRFCETAGAASYFLRDSIPTEIQGG